MKKIWSHLRDIALLPGVVSVVVPWFIYKYSPELIPKFLSIQLFALFLFIIGVALFCWTIYLFQTIADGTLAPWTAKNKLIITGPYRYCRNPMVTGVLLVLLSEGLGLRSATILEWALIFFLINTCFFIFKEEPFLENKFGEEYKKYKRNVPRWIPRLIIKGD